MTPGPDPRPLTGEPLALDLVNTTWVDDAGPHDLLDDAEQARGWLGRWKLTGAAGPRDLEHLRSARAALRGVLEHPGDEDARAALDAGRPGERVEVPAPWRASWLAARDLLHLLEHRPERIKPCANPDCVLWFADTTRSGTRRWCSMTGGCGSRLKARRHQGRRRTGRSG